MLLARQKPHLIVHGPGGPPAVDRREVLGRGERLNALVDGLLLHGVIHGVIRPAGADSNLMHRVLTHHLGAPPTHVAAPVD